MIIKRSIFTNLKKHLDSPEISLLTGPRQTGKTFLMRLLEDSLKKETQKTLFLNFDFDENKKFLFSQNALLEKIRLEVGQKKAFIFLDEIQRKENAGLFLKGLYDMNLPYKFIVSGSGSLELKEKIHESLTGRKRIFEIKPLNFLEFVNFKTSYRYEEKIKDFFSIENQQAQNLLQEYMAFGSYPKVVLKTSQQEKKEVIKDIFQSYLERDIISLLHLEKSESLTNLLKIVASQIGSLVNNSELSSTLDISSKTIKKYLWYLEKTFIIKKIFPYFTNIRKEINKMPVYYFYDIGLRNYLLGIFAISDTHFNQGHLFENFILNTLSSQLNYASTKICFWRTRDQAEVDFVIQIGTETIPIEVKFTDIKKPAISRSFRSFLNKYRPKKAFVIHLGKKQKILVNKTTVSFLPFYQTSSIFS